MVVLFLHPVGDHLDQSLKEREEISRGLAAGESLRQIAAKLKRPPSTISRHTVAKIMKAKG